MQTMWVSLRRAYTLPASLDTNLCICRQCPHRLTTKQQARSFTSVQFKAFGISAVIEVEVGPIKSQNYFGEGRLYT